MFINNLGHMTKMAAMSIYGKNPSKIFYSGTYAFELGKNLKSHLRLKSCRKWVVGLSINDSQKVGPKGLYGRTPGNIHVYYQNIQTSSRKPLGQLKPNFM